MSEWNGEKSTTHFTEITVDGIRSDIRRILERGGKTLPDPFESTSELSGIDELRWQLGIICPVEYSAEYPIPKSDIDPKRDKLLIDQTTALASNNFHISLNGADVKRQITLPSYDTDKLNRGTEAKLLLKRGLGYDIAYLESPVDSKVKYRGYLLVQAYQLFPQQLRGILVRLRGVAVGWHRTINLGATAATMLGSMSGEVWVDGLDDALQFDRESFREDHPLYEWFRLRLQEVVNDETTLFRTRSARRMQIVKRNRASGKQATKASRPAKKPTKAKVSTLFVASDIFDKMPEYIQRLVPQINGCYHYCPN